MEDGESESKFAPSYPTDTAVSNMGVSEVASAVSAAAEERPTDAVAASSVSVAAEVSSSNTAASAVSAAVVIPPPATEKKEGNDTQAVLSSVPSRTVAAPLADTVCSDGSSNPKVVENSKMDVDAMSDDSSHASQRFRSSIQSISVSRSASPERTMAARKFVPPARAAPKAAEAPRPHRQ